MPDELDALRHFRDETPGPSTDAWNRARAAIAAARSEEEPVGRRRGRVPGRPRMLFAVTAVAVTAAVAGLVAVLLPSSPATRGSGALIETTAFVTHVEHALSGQRNVVGYARTSYPPGFRVESISPGGLRVSLGSGPWTVSGLVRWFYRDTYNVSAFTVAGQRLFDLRIALVHGTLASTGVFYRSRTWWRGTIGPAQAPNRHPPARCGATVQLGPGGWPDFLRHELSCGEFTKGGQQRIGGIAAVKLTGNGGQEVFWVNPRTYLPVRAILTAPSGGRLQTDFGWFTPTRARLAQLHLPVPPGFRQVAPPAQSPGR